MYASELRTYGLSAVVSVLLGAGIGLGWHYFADSAGGRAVAAAATPLAQQDTSQPSFSNPPVLSEDPVLDAPPFPGLSHYPQPAVYNGPPMTVGKVARAPSRHKLPSVAAQSNPRF
jgi:hypothetical protein